MGLDIKTLAAAKKYTSETVEGGGAVVGKNVTISSIIPIDGGNRITFSYTLDSGTTKTSTLDVMNGIDGDVGQPGKDGLDGKSIIDATVNDSNQLILTLSDNTTINAGIITTLKGDTGLAGRDGTTPQFSIGTVTTIDSNQEASASITGTSANPILNLSIPKGEAGSDINSSDEKVKLTPSSTNAYYLEDLIDNNTIEIDAANGVIKAISLDGLETTIATLNFIKNLDKDIMTYLSSIGNPMAFKGVVSDDAALNAITDMASGDTYIVQRSASNSDKTMTFIYNGIDFVPMAETTIEVRDFTANPIDLSTETTGILPKEKIDEAIARLANVLDKTTYKGSADGVVKQADTITGLSTTISQLNQAITDSHSHANKTALDKIVYNGIGNRLLADNGAYKEILVLSSTQPSDDYCIWADNTDSSKIVLKIFDGTDWVAVSGFSNENNSGTTITVDAAMSDTSTNPVQNKVIKKYVDDKSVDISTQTGNAIHETSDGLFVEDKTDEISNINNKVESIAKYQKYINTELDYCYLRIPKSSNNINLSSDSVIPFDNLIDGNLEINQENHSIILKANKTYEISCDIQLGSVTGYARSCIYDLTNNINIVTFTDGSLSYSSTGSTISHTVGKCIYSPETDTEIQVKVISSNNAVAFTSYEENYFIVKEINKAITIDPLEYVNSESGIEDTPVGHIIAQMGTTAPAHYLICDGTEYNIADYPYLAQHFIDNFGSANYFGGDGQTTFCTPDLRGEFLRGTGTATRNIGSGANVGEHQDPTRTPLMYAYPDRVNNVVTWRADDGDLLTDGAASHHNADKMLPLIGNIKGFGVNGQAITSSMTTASYTSRPTNTSVLYCIKYEPTYYMKVEGKDVYSTEETMIGYWIDGKPLYRKVIETTVPVCTTNGTSVQRDIDISALSTETVCKCVALVNGNKFWAETPLFSGNTPQNFLRCYIENDNLGNGAIFRILNASTSYNSYPAKCIIEYTKVSD